MGDDTEQLREEIATRRDELSATIDEIATRTSPRHAARRGKRRLQRLRHAPMVDAMLAYASVPTWRLLGRRVHLRRRKEREFDASDIQVPPGFAVDLVATGFNTPVHCSFDDEGACYVTECGHKVEAAPRILKVDTGTGRYETWFELPEEQWRITGALTGGCWLDGEFYFANTDRICRRNADGTVDTIVDGLPWGDHQTNHPVVGPDGKLYWGQGTCTNTAVVGPDNWAYEWLRHHPDQHDVPGQDVVLAGHNYEMRNVLGSLRETVRTGAYVPFGTATAAGQVIKGDVKASGSVLRCNPDGTGLELVAWGLRNPYGLAFAADGRLFATEHGIDERNPRHIIGDYDDLYEIVDGRWYGWPDFASGIRLDDPHWGEGGRGREPVLAEHPDPDPPKPFVTFAPHAGANGVDFCRDAAFGFEGDAFVALFGDVTPVTARRRTPVGFKVVRVDMATREVVDFAVNRVQGPAAKLPHEGFERPSHCAFGPDGALYVVDWGEIDLAPEKGGIRTQTGTGALWRVRRTDEPVSHAPPPSQVVPTRALRAGAIAAGAAVAGAAGAAIAWTARRRRR